MAGNRDPQVKQVLLVLTDGFEEIEAITPIDILRRAGCEVLVAGLDKKVVVGSHGVLVTTDVLLREVKELPDALVLPGGPGAEDLGRSTALRGWVLRMSEAKKIISAICAAPATVLAVTGVLEGKKATCFPGYENRLGMGGAIFSSDRVVTDGEVITSRGAGTAMEFSLELVRKLMGSAKASEISETILAGA